MNLKEKIEHYISVNEISYQEGIEIIEEIKLLDNDSKKDMLCLIIDSDFCDIEELDPIFQMILKEFKEELTEVYDEIDPISDFELQLNVIDVTLLHIQKNENFKIFICKKMNNKNIEPLFDVMKEHFLKLNGKEIVKFSKEDFNKLTQYVNIVMNIIDINKEWNNTHNIKQ